MTFPLSRLWSRRPSSSRGRRKAVARPRFELLEDRLAPATHRWLGIGADANWTTDANWLNEETNVVGAPNSADDVLVFPTGAQRLSNVNNFAAGTTFQQLNFTGAGYSLGGNQLRLPGGIVSSGTNTVAFPIETSDIMPVTVSSSSLTVSGVIGGAGGLTKEGNGLLVLSGENRFLGDVDLIDGVIRLQHPAALGSTAGRTTVFNIGTNIGILELNGGISVPEDIVLAGGTIRGLTGPVNFLTGTITSVGTGTLQVNSGGVLHVTGSGSLQGDSYLKTGPGELRLARANGHSGTTTVSAGRIEITHPQALGSTAGNTVVQNGATLAVVGILDSPIAEPLSLTGAGNGGVDGALRVISRNTFSGPITLASSASIFIGANTETTLSGVISGSTFSALNKIGTGTLVLAAANTYLGFTDVREGELRLASNGALGGTTSNTRVLAGATLEFVGFNSFNEPLSLAGAGNAGSGALRQVSGGSTWLGPINLESPTTVRVDAGTFRMSGVVSGAQAATFTKTGAGTLGLAAANTFAGQLRIQEGAVNMTNGEALGAAPGQASGTFVSAGAALELAGSITVNDEAIFLAGTGVGGTGALRSRSGVNRIEQLAGFTAFVRFDTTNVAVGVDAGELQMPVNDTVDNAGLTKVGAGKLVLIFQPFVPGPSTVAAGELQMSGSLGPVTVNNGATLSGSGTVRGNLTVNAGGVVSPGLGGDSVSTIIVNNGNVQFNAGSTYRVQLFQNGPQILSDRIALTGSGARNVTISNATLNLKATFNPAAGTQFRIIDNQTTGTTTGQFNGLPEGGTITSSDGIPFRISYIGGTGNDTVLTRNTPSMAEYVFMYPEEIYAGEYTYLVGQLTDPDEEEYVGLYISWGDGSEDQFEFPGTEPFVYYHQYTEPGEYYVFVFWFDVAGEGNFAVLPVRVLEAGAAPGSDGGAAAALVAAEGAGQRVVTPQAEAVAAPRGEQEMPRADFGLSEPAVAEVIRALAQSQDAKSEGMDTLFATEEMFQV